MLLVARGCCMHVFLVWKVLWKCYLVQWFAKFALIAWLFAGELGNISQANILKIPLMQTNKNRSLCQWRDRSMKKNGSDGVLLYFKWLGICNSKALAESIVLTKNEHIIIIIKLLSFIRMQIWFISYSSLASSLKIWSLSLRSENFRRR